MDLLGNLIEHRNQEDLTLAGSLRSLLLIAFGISVFFGIAFWVIFHFVPISYAAILIPTMGTMFTAIIAVVVLRILLVPLQHQNHQVLMKLDAIGINVDGNLSRAREEARKSNGDNHKLLEYIALVIQKGSSEGIPRPVLDSGAVMPESGSTRSKAPKKESE